jgi:hypothetical protein
MSASPAQPSQTRSGAASGVSFCFLHGPRFFSAPPCTRLEHGVLVCIVCLQHTMSGRGSNRKHDGHYKEWRPYSGQGHRLGDNHPGAPDMEFGGVGKTPHGDGSQTTSPRRAVTSPGQAVTSPGSGSHGSWAEEIRSPIVDLEAEPGNTCESLEHPEWASMVCMPTRSQWQQKENWTLCDLVLDPVRSQVFAHGDLGRILIPGGQLAAFRNDESPSSMVSVLQTCVLAVLHDSLSVFGRQVMTDDLPIVADRCLHEGLITPMQHTYCIWLDRHGKKTLLSSQ